MVGTPKDENIENIILFNNNKSYYITVQWAR